MQGHAELELLTVGKIEGRFLVPSYQRGYRWQKEEVKQLLDDLWTSARATPPERYCLQPVVVKRTAAGDWELIDGQQRLTTLYLLYLYFRRERLQNYEQPFLIQYETRERCAAFLAGLGAEESTASPEENEDQSEPENDRGNGDKDALDDNIDFHHMREAYRTIDCWFKAQQRQRQSAANLLDMHLQYSVDVVWYRAPDGVNGNDLFRRLNYGRIALTNAELIKALLFKGTAERRDVLAAQWDAIERDLRNEERWAFLSNAPAEAYPVRIQLIFDLMAGGPTGRERKALHTFDMLGPRIKADPDAFWRDTLEMHARACEWFDDRELYHQIGFLIDSGEPLTAIVADSVTAKQRSAFREQVRGKVVNTLNQSAESLAELRYGASAACSRVLFLYNVWTACRSPGSAPRFSFRDHKRTSWSLEHIHAQNAEHLRGDAARREWLDDHCEALQTLGLDSATLMALETRMRRTDATSDKGEVYGTLVRDVARTFMLVGEESGEWVHGLANLALLGRAANSALNNSVFEVKRQKLIELDRKGEYIPPCTRRVFLKYDSPNAGEHLHYWTASDRAAYLKVITETLTPFLKAGATIPDATATDPSPTNATTPDATEAK
jgi:aryl carrier-like protein